MEFCIITPYAGLQKYATLSKRHLVLAKQCYNKQYLEFYATRRQAGDFLILDNNAYEDKALDGPAYYNIITALNPQVVVLPDLLMGEWRHNASLALRFLDEFGDRLVGRRIEYMYVPQIDRQPHQGWFQSLATAINDGRHGYLIKWVGLGRYLSQYGLEMRSNLAKTISEEYPHLHLHALGMANGNVAELPLLADAGVESVDSSAPVWRGWNGFALHNPEWEEKGTPCDFSAKFPDTSLDSYSEIILQNLEACNVDTTRAR